VIGLVTCEIQKDIEVMNSITTKLNDIAYLIDPERDPHRRLTVRAIFVDDKYAPDQAGTHGLEEVVAEQVRASNAVDVGDIGSDARIQVSVLRLANFIGAERTPVPNLDSPSDSFKWGAVTVGLSQAVNALSVEDGRHVVVMTDIDSSQNLRELFNLVNPIVRNQAAAVIGSRFIEGAATTENIGLHNFVEFGPFNHLARLELLANLSTFIGDVQSGLKAFDARILSRVIGKMKTFGPAGDAELLYLITAEGGRIIEVPRSETEAEASGSHFSVSRYRDFVEQLRRQVRAHQPDGRTDFSAAGNQLALAIDALDGGAIDSLQPQLAAILDQVHVGAVVQGEGSGAIIGKLGIEVGADAGLEDTLNVFAGFDSLPGAIGSAIPTDLSISGTALNEIAGLSPLQGVSASAPTVSSSSRLNASHQQTVSGTTLVESTFIPIL